MFRQQKPVEKHIRKIMKLSPGAPQAIQFAAIRKHNPVKPDAV